MANQSEKSLFAKVLGRSFFSVIFGKFFESKNNTAGFIAACLVATLCSIVIYKANTISSVDKIIEGVLNVVFVVVGYYFGAKGKIVTEKEPDETE